MTLSDRAARPAEKSERSVTCPVFPSLSWDAQVWQAIHLRFTKWASCGGAGMLHLNIEGIMRFVVATEAAPYLIKIALLLVALVVWEFE
jgi:uncharacterized membrane protein